MTYEELLSAGATPGDAPAKKGAGLTYEQLVAAGAEAGTPQTGKRFIEPTDDDESPTSGGPTFSDQTAELRKRRAELGPAVDASPLGLAKQAAVETGQGFQALGRGALAANDFVARSMLHPVDTYGGGKAPAVGREALRGINSNIPFANEAVEAAGGPAASSPADEALAPGARAAGTVAGLPIGNLVGGIAAKTVEGSAPLISRAITTADNAIGKAALNRAATAGENHGLEKFGRRAGSVAGLLGGAHHGGLVEGLVGGHYSSKVGGTIGRGADLALDRAAGRLADRHAANLARNIGRTPAATIGASTSYASPVRRALGPMGRDVVDADFLDPNAPVAHTPPAPAVQRQLNADEGLDIMRLLQEGPRGPSGHKVVPGADLSGIFGPDVVPSRTSLAPLVPQGPAANYRPSANAFDELTHAGPPASNHATVGGATAVKPRLQILDENGRDLIGGPGSLRSDIMRDVGRIRAEPPEGPAAPIKDVLGDQLANSVRLLDELRAGKITPKQALDAGLPPGIVARAAH